MLKAPTPASEEERLKTLINYEVLDSYQDSHFDEITRTASLICNCSISLVSLIDRDRQWFKSKYGTDATETPRDISFCGHAIMSEDLFIVEDAEEDIRFCDNPLFLQEPNVRFYAGAPLIAPNGERIGTLCVIDSEVRSLSENQKMLLKTLSKQVINYLELRKKANELSNSEAKRARVLSNMLEGMVIQDSSGNVLEFNSTALDILALTEDQLLGKSAMDPNLKWIKVDGSPFPIEEHPSMIAIKTGTKVENIIMGVDLPNRPMKWIRINSIPLDTENGINSISTFQDITELLEKNSEIESYVKGLDTHAIVAKTDKQGKITYVNKMFCEISEYSKEELIGKNHRILNSGHHSKEFFKQMWATISAGKIWRAEILNVSKTGKHYWVDTTISPLMDRDGKVREYIAFRHDITKKMLAEIELRNSENKLRQIFSQSKDAVMTIEPPAWHFTSCNPATLRLFNVASEEDYTKLGLWDISPVKQPNGELSSRKMQEMILIAMEKGVHFFEWIHRTLENRDIPCTILLSRIEEGSKVYLHAVIRDISEQKKLEESIVNSNQELQEAVFEQLILKKLLSLSTDFSLDLGKKLKSGLEILFELPWLEILHKGAVFLVNDNQLELVASKDLGTEFDAICSQIEAGKCFCGRALDSNPLVHSSCIDKTLAGSVEPKSSHDPYSVTILNSVKDPIGVIVLFLKQGYPKLPKIKKFLESASEIFSTIIQTHNLQLELVDTNAYLDLAFEGAGLGIWDWRLTDNSVTFDKRLGEMLGLNSDELHMDLTTWENRIHPEDLEKYFDDIKGFFEGETNFYENIHRMKHKNGHWIYILDRGRFSEWDRHEKPTRFTGTHFNISELESTKQKLSLLYQNSPFGYVFCDLEGKFIDVNQKFEEITGRSFNELEGLSYRDITPEKFGLEEPIQLEYLRKTGKYGPYRKEFYTKSGDTVSVELNDFIVKDFNGKEGIWSIVEDITEKLNQEKELQNQKIIASHNSKLASIGELAAGVGHEINNPLAILMGYLKSVQELVDNNSVETENVQYYIDKINLAADRISRIVKGLRNFSRSDSVDISYFSPVEAVEESFYMFNDIYKRDGINIKLESKVTNDLVSLGNRGKFQQVFMNLISNAKDAVSKNEDKQIEVTLSESDNQIVVSVKDNGCGIPKALQEKIFDPFFTTKEVNKGTGIGLSLVYTMVKELNGSLRVESEENKGANFVVELPASLKTQSKAKPKVQALAKRKIEVNALLAEDDEGVREVLTYLLKNMGLTVSPVVNGLQALDLYSKQPERFDLIISDMQMPTMDGQTLLRRIRSMKEIKQPKFIFITGGINIDFDDKDSELNKLIDGCFFKPFNEQEIFKILSKIFDK